MVKIIKRNSVDLEVSYRKLLTKGLWVAYSLVIVAGILAVGPIYLYGDKYYLTPFLFGTLPLAVCYFIFTRNLSTPLEKASPKFFLSALFIPSIIFCFLSYYTVNHVYLKEIESLENKAKENLIAFALFLNEEKLFAKEDNKELKLNVNWNDEESFPPLPEKFNGVMHWVRSKNDIENHSQVLDGYYYYYRCSTLDIWHIWCAPQNHPDGGRRTWILNYKGEMLSRDFKGKSPQLLQFPEHKRDLIRFEKHPRVNYPSQLADTIDS